MNKGKMFITMQQIKPLVVREHRYVQKIKNEFSWSIEYFYTL